jgi:hypothetical protein
VFGEWESDYQSDFQSELGKEKEKEKEKEKTRQEESTINSFLKSMNSNSRQLNEFESYYALPGIFVTADLREALNWWNANKEAFPVLYWKAHIYLKVPCGTARIESLFSIFGNIYTKKRKRLNETNLMFLKMKLLEDGEIEDKETYEDKAEESEDENEESEDENEENEEKNEENEDENEENENESTLILSE